jgi:hypothetical protein
MTLERSTFREVIKTALEASGIVAVGSVFAERVRPTREDQLPAIIIEVGDERYSKRSTSPRTFKVECELRVEIVTQLLDDSVALCEGVSEQARAVLNDWLSLTADYESLDIEKFSLVVEDGGEQEIASGLATYSAIWCEESPSSQNTSLTPLLTIHVETDLPDTGDDIDREQTIPITQDE